MLAGRGLGVIRGRRDKALEGVGRGGYTWLQALGANDDLEQQKEMWNTGWHLGEKR